jgi:hypothetical protein
MTLLNRNPNSPLDVIDLNNNEGLRVVKILRTNASFGYRIDADKHYSAIVFDIVKSEDEDFSLDFTTWNTT